MAVACLLIANSHLEGLYPRSWMAADGLLGNSIFFLLAGYGVAISQTKRPYGLGSFYRRRVVRIYPTLFVVMVIGWILNLAHRPESLGEGFKQLVWPTHYKFVAQIMIFYPFAWLLARFDLKAVKAALGASLLGWIVCVTHASLEAAQIGEKVSLGSLPATIWWSFFFCVFLMGVVLGKRDAVEGDLPCKKPLLLTAIAGGCFVAYVGLKFLYSRGQLSSLPPTLACSFLQILGLVIVTAFVLLRHQIQALLDQVGLLKAGVWLGKSSLQVYLSHMWFAHAIEGMALPWPIKVLFFFVMAIVVAWGLRLFMEAVEKKVSRKTEA